MKQVLYRSDNINHVIKEVLSTFRRGGLVISPSDTVYGLLVDTLNTDAVNKLMLFKNRPTGKPISVFVADMKMLYDYVVVSSSQEKLLSSLLPGPFTIILKSKHHVSPLLESERGTLGVRFPDYPLITDLVRRWGRPLTATSANLSGRPPHYQLSTLLDELSEKKKALVDLAVDAGRLPYNKPSTIIDLTQDEVRILRKGDILFSSSQRFVSTSPAQTKKIAQFILSKLMKKNSRPLVFIIKGDLGTGKTVFVKGIGEAFGVKNIISPTYTISYEYPLNTQKGKLAHFDLYNIQEEDELKYLGIEAYLRPGNILCFEWGEKAGSIINLLKEKTRIVEISLKYSNRSHRELLTKFP